MSATAFAYDAIGADGARTRGRIQAPSQVEACRRLRAEGLTPLKVAPARAESRLFTFQRVTSDEVVDLTQQLAMLVQSRIPLAQGLMSIAEQDAKPALRDMLVSIASSIEAGASIPESLEPHRHVLGDIYIETMAAAQRSGNLSDALEHLSEVVQKQAEARRQLKKAMTYPAIVLAVVALAVSVIIVFVVPRFGATFRAQGVEMPLVTQIIQAVGQSVRANWWAYASTLAGAVAAGTLLWRSASGRLVYERAFLSLPFIRRLVVATTIARFGRVLGLGIGSGLDMIDAIQMAGRATGRPLFVNECAVVADRLRRGEDLAEALKDSRYLPSFARRMLTAGEDAREMSRACSIVARQYDREATHLTGQINTLIEPLLTLVLACVVLLVALSVFLPMWQMVRVSN